MRGELWAVKLCGGPQDGQTVELVDPKEVFQVFASVGPGVAIFADKLSIHHLYRIVEKHPQRRGRWARAEYVGVAETPLASRPLGG